MVEEEGTRTINFMVSSIQINNLAEGLQVSYEPDAEIALRFSGDQKALEMTGYQQCGFCGYVCICSAGSI